MSEPVAALNAGRVANLVLVQVVLQFDELEYIEIVVLFKTQASALITAAAVQLKKRQIREGHYYSLCGSTVSINLTMLHAHGVESCISLFMIT